MQQDLVRMNVPVVVVQSEYEEFIKREHAKYIVESLPNGEFLLLQGVSHFAPLQPLEPFNTAILELARKVDQAWQDCRLSCDVKDQPNEPVPEARTQSRANIDARLQRRCFDRCL
jgi:hypothetical protein